MEQGYASHGQGRTHQGRQLQQNAKFAIQPAFSHNEECKSKHAEGISNY